MSRNNLRKHETCALRYLVSWERDLVGGNTKTRSSHDQTSAAISVKSSPSELQEILAFCGMRQQIKPATLVMLTRVAKDSIVDSGYLCGHVISKSSVTPFKPKKKGTYMYL